jgi:hypothetical protein
VGKPTADRAGRDPGDYQHRGTGQARPPCRRAVIAVSTFFLALVNPVPLSFLHYSIVWEVIEGVDVVAHNGAGLSVFSRTGCLRGARRAVAALSAATPQCGSCCRKIHRHWRRLV